MNSKKDTLPPLSLPRQPSSPESLFDLETLHLTADQELTPRVRKKQTPSPEAWGVSSSPVFFARAPEPQTVGSLSSLVYSEEAFAQLKMSKTPSTNPTLREKRYALIDSPTPRAASTSPTPTLPLIQSKTNSQTPSPLMTSPFQK